MNKIFIIGFNKTASTSLHRLFKDSHIPSIHWDFGRLAKTMMLNIQNQKKIFDSYDKDYIVFSDMVLEIPELRFDGNFYFDRMNKDYPDSLFIYNFRNVDDWVKSRIIHYNRVKIDGWRLIDLELKRLNTTSINELIKVWMSQRERLELLLTEPLDVSH